MLEKLTFVVVFLYCSVKLSFEIKRIIKIIKKNKLKIGFLFCRVFNKIPINRNKIVLVNSHSYDLLGNLKFIDDELNKSYKEYKKIVITKANLGSITGKLKSYYHVLTSKYVILNDYFTLFGNFKKRKETVLIQVWHAAGAFKKFGKHSLRNKQREKNYKKSLHCHSQYDIACVSSEKVRGIYADAFNLPLENVLPLGVPRTDFFFDKIKKKEVKKKLYEKYEQLKNKKVILYAPTYRDGERKSFDLKLDVKTILKELGEEYIIILKMHPYIKNSLLINSPEGKNILDLSNEDVNELMIVSDYLITDYSSLCFEYSLLGKPIIFYAYDYEEYGSKLRGFYYKYEEFIPGPLVTSNNEIIELIKKNNFDLFKIKSFAEDYFDYLDGASTKRILNKIF